MAEMMSQQARGPGTANYWSFMASASVLGPEWLPGFVQKANNGGIERVLL